MVVVVNMSDTHAGAYHILKKHSGSRRPSSWRTPTITQSPEEALAQIGETKVRRREKRRIC